MGTVTVDIECEVEMYLYILLEMLFHLRMCMWTDTPTCTWSDLYIKEKQMNDQPAV